LYTPAPWLHPGSNAVIFFDLMGGTSDRLKTVTKPIFGAETSARD
jgi:hypothetical protein